MYTPAKQMVRCLLTANDDITSNLPTIYKHLAFGTQTGDIFIQSHGDIFTHSHALYLTLTIFFIATQQKNQNFSNILILAVVYQASRQILLLQKAILYENTHENRIHAKR